MKKHWYAALALLSFASAASAQLSVTAPWVRATVPAQKSTGAFMHLQSEREVRLVEVSSPVADAVQIHQMEMRADRMLMQEVDGIDLPAGKGVNLAAGGYHIMLIGLKQQLKSGDTVPLTLVVQHKNKTRESLTVEVPVKPITFVNASR